MNREVIFMAGKYPIEETGGGLKDAQLRSRLSGGGRPVFETRVSGAALTEALASLYAEMGSGFGPPSARSGVVQPNGSR